MAEPLDDFLQKVRAEAEDSGLFGQTEVVGGMLKCEARDSAEPAWYCLDFEGGTGHVSLVTFDRWLSESIEADLMHYGDPIEELIEEELDELGYKGDPLSVKHYRSPDMLYTFRSPLPIGNPAEPSAAQTAWQCLAAYEAAFRELGDMAAELENDEESGDEDGED